MATPVKRVLAAVDVPARQQAAAARRRPVEINLTWPPVLSVEVCHAPRGLEEATKAVRETYARSRALCQERSFWARQTEHEMRAIEELVNRVCSRSVRREAALRLGLTPLASRLGREAAAALASLAALCNIIALRARHPGRAGLSQHQLAAFLETDARVVEKRLVRGAGGRIVGLIETSSPASQAGHGEQR